MAKRPGNTESRNKKVGRVPRVTSWLLSKTDNADPLINRVNESINEFNEFVSLFPLEYGWRFKTKDALEEELRENLSLGVSPWNMNKLYWEDALKNLEAYTVMSVWRVTELLKNAVSSLTGGETIASAIIARAAIESVAQFLDITRKVSPTLEQLKNFDFQKEIVTSTELEELILKSVFSSKLPDAETEYNPTNILTILKRISKVPGQSELISRYEVLCEVAHPNFLGRAVYVTETRAGKISGDEVRTLSPKHGAVSKDLINLALWAISWSAATQVSSAVLMQSSLGSTALRLRNKPH